MLLEPAPPNRKTCSLDPTPTGCIHVQIENPLYSPKLYAGSEKDRVPLAFNAPLHRANGEASVNAGTVLAVHDAVYLLSKENTLAS